MKNNKLSLNINDEDTTFMYCWDKFDELPNVLRIFNNYNKKGFNEVIKINNYNLLEIVTTEIIPADEFDVINEKYIIKISEDIYMSYLIIDLNSDDSLIQDLVFYYKSNNTKLVKSIVEGLSFSITESSDFNDYKLNTVTISQNGLDIEPILEQEIDENLDLYYNPKTLKSIKKLTKSIKKSDKGLSILYGEKGTGKTNIINFIAKKTNKTVIYIPNTLLDSTINNSEFRNFLKRFDEPIIIIDDCEVAFNEVFSKTNIYVNNLLQLIDGFISDNINIITIFNVDDINEIDHNLLDSNSLLDIVEFEYLKPNGANELGKLLKKDKKFKTNTRLIDIIRNMDSIKINKIGLN